MAPARGRVHILRHTFCSRLAAGNVPMLTLHGLAGHESLETAQRYMHLSSTAPREGIAEVETGSHGERGSPPDPKASENR